MDESRDDDPSNSAAVIKPAADLPTLRGASTPLTSAPDLVRVQARFAHVTTWVFDLDNTLYPASSDLWPKIDARITMFLAHLFGLDGLSARALQKYFYKRYGTTLNGLMEEHAISSDDFLHFVHDIDRSSLAPNHNLARSIAALPGRKLILTNGSRNHALETARALGIDHMFEDIFDIVAAGLTPKPAPQTYETFFEKHGVDPTSAAMFEDISHNLVVPHARGMITTLIVPEQGGIDHRDPWDIAGADAAHIDFITSDLELFLEQIIPGLPVTRTPR